jgi:small-conductance mechanosensitive channel
MTLRSGSPRRTLGALTLALTLTPALAGCGLFDRGATPDPGAIDSLAVVTTAQADSGAVAPDSSGALVGATPDSLTEVAAAPTVDTAAQDSAAVVTSQIALPAAAQLLTVDQRIERLLASQEAMSRRLDSLTTARAVADSVRRAPASGEVLGEAGRQVRNFGAGVVWSTIVLVLFNISIRTLVWLLDTLAERNASRRLFYKRLVPIVRIVLWIFAAYLVVRVIFRVDAQGLFAAAAAVGVAVGFAAQDLLKNLFGGLILVFDQPFQAGDKISVGGTYGEVVSIGLRSTRIVTPDDNLVSVPNSQVVDGQVANANAGELNCQVDTDLYLPGWADETTAKRIAFEAAASSTTRSVWRFLWSRVR